MRPPHHHHHILEHYSQISPKIHMWGLIQTKYERFSIDRVCCLTICTIWIMLWKILWLERIFLIPTTCFEAFLILHSCGTICMVYGLGQRAINTVSVKYIGGNPFVLIPHQLGLYDLDAFQVELVCALSYYTNSQNYVLWYFKLSLCVLEYPIC